jgi:hypothetical protein
MERITRLLDDLEARQTPDGFRPKLAAE